MWIVCLPKSDRIHASYLSNLYWYFPWFHELSFPWYGFENPIEPIEPVEIYVYYSGMDRKAMTESCEGKGNLCYEAGKTATSLLQREG